jgi:hypothetical protein
MDPMQYAALSSTRLSEEEGWFDYERYHATRDDARRRRHERMQRVMRRWAHGQ